MKALPTIEKNVPVPLTTRGGVAYRPLIEALQVGDSFVLAGLTSSGAWSRLLPHVRRTKMRLTIRAVNGGVRVWRVA